MISNNLNCLWQPRMSILPLADFTIFNDAYDSTQLGDHIDCATCSGTGGFITTELVGDPPMIGYQDTFEACNDCIGNEKCPGCGADLKLSFDLSAFGTDVVPPMETIFAFLAGVGNLHTFSIEDALAAMPFEGFTCLCCGWQYDPDRHYDQAAEYTDYDFEADQDWQASAYHRVDPFED